MKMKHIASAVALFATSFTLVSCNKGGKEEVSAQSHDQIASGIVTEMTAMMTDMSSIKDVATAEAFAAKVPATKQKMKDYLKAAQALPAPTEAEKAAYQQKMNDAQEKAGPAMMAMMMGMSQNPDAEAIGKVREGVMKDDEMDKTMETLEGIYAVAEAPAPAPAPGDAGEAPAAE